MRGTVLALLGLCLGLSLHARDIYVDGVYGGLNPNGSFLHPWPTIQAAIDAGLLPGDKVHIKAGLYQDGGFQLQHSGTPELPIRFIGYQLNPGDTPTARDPRSGLSPLDMPLLKGTSPATGIAIDLNGQDHVHIEHIQLLDYRLGIRNMLSPREESTGINLQHIIGRNFGIPYNTEYSGWGILIDDNGNSLVDCLIIDAGAEGIGIYGDQNSLTNCKVANYDDDHATDYFIVVLGNSNELSGCTIHRDYRIVSHSGHGIGIKNGVDNLVHGCTSVNTNKGFFVSGPECSGNVFRDCVAQNEVGIVIRDGAHQNRFQDCVVTDTEVAVRFIDSIEFGEQSDGVGSDNLIINCLFQHNRTAIEFRAEEYGSPVEGNLFHSCIFHDATQLVSAGTEASDNGLVNCVVTDMQLLDEWSNSSSLQELGLRPSSSLSWSNSFQLPLDTGFIEVPPDFLDRHRGDFRPSPMSPLIENGVLHPSWPMDFLGVLRPLDADMDGLPSADLGIFEFSEELLLLDESPTQGALGRIFDLNAEDSLYSEISLPWSHHEVDKRFIIYPNPLTSGDGALLHLIPKAYECPESIQLRDCQGRLIRTFQACQLRLDIGQIPGGTYLLELGLTDGQESHRVVIR